MPEYRILEGDCVEAMREMPENSVDAVVCDPPYGLEFMGKEWDRLWTAAKRDKAEGHVGSDGVRRNKTAPVSRNTPLASYQGGYAAQAWHETWAKEALRVLKPGGHLLAFGGTRTSHRLACAIEDAGFEIRDTIRHIKGGDAIESPGSLAWIYGSG